MIRRRRHILVGAAAMAVAAAGVAWSAPKVPPKPKLTIGYFKEQVPPGVMAAGSGPRRATSTTITFGEEVVLEWRIDVCYIQAVTTKVSGGPVDPGTRREGSGGCAWYTGTHSVHPERTTTYELWVAGSPVPDAEVAPVPVTARYEVRVIRPELEVLEPTIDQRTLTLTFRARNRGDADLAVGSINATYHVHGVVRGPSPLIDEGTVHAAGMAIRRGQTVTLGTATLPDRSRALAYDNIVIQVEVAAASGEAFAPASGRFPHRWETRTGTLTASLLSLMSSIASCEIDLNNYQPGLSWPVVPRDGLVALRLGTAGEEMNFDVPPERLVYTRTGSVTGHVYKEIHFAILLNHLGTRVEGRSDIVSVRDGKLALHLEFANAGGPEVKIGEVVDTNHFVDDELPDIDIGPFNVDILLTPSNAGTRVSYSRAEVQVSPLSASLSGRFDWLNPFIHSYLSDYVHRTVRDQLNSLIGSRRVKSAVEDALLNAMESLTGPITRITNVTSAGDAITITYL